MVVAVEVTDPHRVQRDARLSGELPGRVTPCVAVLPGDQQEAPQCDEILDRRPRAREERYRLSSAGYASKRWSSCGRRSPWRSATIRESPVTDLLSRFAPAAIDGAFVACQADRGAWIEQLLQPLPASLAASRRSLLARAD